MPKLPVNRIKFFGVFSIEQLMHAVMGWYKSEGYEMLESTHKYKVTQGSDFDITLNGERPITPYWKNKVTTQIKTYGCREVDITKGKQVVQALHGRVYIWISPELIEDWQGRFAHGIYKKLHNFYKNYVIDAQMGTYWDKLFYEARNGLEPAIKKALNFDTVMKSGGERHSH